MSDTRVKVTIEITRRAPDSLPGEWGILEGALLTEKHEYELDPAHTDLRFAASANEGWPSQCLEEMPSMKEDLSKVIAAEGFLVCLGLVTKRVGR